MRSPELPEDGPVRVGAVSLPAGQRVAPLGGDAQPVAWVTGVEVPDPGRVWSALSELRGQTGLAPVLLEGEEAGEGYFFHRPVRVSEIGRLDPAIVLAALWDAKREDTAGPAVMFDAPLSMRFLGLDPPPPGGPSLADIAGAIFDVTTDPAAHEELTRLNAIDRRSAGWPQAVSGDPLPVAEAEPFPGLAPPADGQLTRAERDSALASLPPARIGLVPAPRPADVPAVAGWSAFGLEPKELWPVRVSANAVWVGAVLRSFEDRFGGTLLKLGPGAQMRLLVDRPPRTLQQATKIAAEHSVFCDECAGQGLRTIPAIAAALTDAPIWTFWWD